LENRPGRKNGQPVDSKKTEPQRQGLPVDANSFLKTVSQKITDLGLAQPAVLLLEAHKPLAFLGSQLLLVAQPTLDLFLPQNFTRHTVNLLSDSAQLEQLIIQLQNRASATTEEKQRCK